MSTMTNRTAIKTAVEAEPGKTAHYYATHYAGTPCRWGWVYAAFERAVYADLIVPSVRQQGQAFITTYTPAEAA